MNIQEIIMKQNKTESSLKSLQQKLEAIKNINVENNIYQMSCEDAIASLKSMEDQHAALVKELEKIVDEQKKVCDSLRQWQGNYDSVSNSKEQYLIESLQHSFALYGFTITNVRPVSHNKGREYTFSFNERCSVTFIECNKQYELINIFPMHTNFAQAKDYLKQTQDITGFLSQLKGYFDAAMSSQQYASIPTIIID